MISVQSRLQRLNGNDCRMKKLNFQFLFFVSLQLSVFQNLAIAGNSLAPDSSAGNTFKVALLLPLQCSQLDVPDTVPDQPVPLVNSSLASIHFYESALMFRDTMKKQGWDVQLNVVDIGADSLKTVSGLNALKLDSADAVLSFLPTLYSVPLLAASKRWKKPVYLFQLSNTGLLEKGPYIRSVVPSNNTQVRLTAGRLAADKKDAAFIAVYRLQRKEKELAGLFAGVIDSCLQRQQACLMLNHKDGGWSGIKSKLIKGKTNVIILPTSDESFLSSFLTWVRDVQEDYIIELVGLPLWESFESPDPLLLTSLHTQIFSGYYPDPKSEEVFRFRKQFIDLYNADPMQSAYMGWDALQIALRDHVVSLVDSSEINQVPLLQLLNGESNMQPVCQNCGFENKSIRILNFREYELTIEK